MPGRKKCCECGCGARDWAAIIAQVRDYPDADQPVVVRRRKG
jgi:hypothetical protein